ncbi:MobQ family relaxase [Sphingobium sp. AN641]|uniref:MobQ family relaxase n=1 Tax=Sphingobium sp. AN641 TaxID=3133443 RepID=UPI0030BE16A4
MAIFSMRVQVVKRSSGRSVIAAAAYRSGTRLHDQRQGITHDYRNKRGVECSEMIFPKDAPAWVQGIDREGFWNAVDASEKRRDAQTAREIYVSIPRELSPDERVRVVRDFVTDSFVSKGMVADIAWHLVPASDGGDNCHAHVMLTMRPLVAGGFGNKVRHEYIPDPQGRAHPDGRVMLVESNSQSWNSAAYYETCRLRWEQLANDALQRAGSSERIDRRSLLERGIARLPEPMLGAAYHMKELYGRMKDRFGQYLAAKHAREVEQRATVALDRLDTISPAEAMRTVERFRAWFDRKLDHLPMAREGPMPDFSTPSHSPDMER